MLGTPYSELHVDLKKVADVETSRMGGLGAIAASAVLCAGIPVLDEVYKLVSNTPQDTKILDEKKHEHLDKLYKAYAKLKLTESMQLGNDNFIMPSKDSEEFAKMLEADTSRAGSNVTTLAKIYKDLLNSKYVDVKSAIELAKQRDITNQFGKDGGARFYGLAKIKIDGKEKTLAEYIVEKKLGKEFLDELKSSHADNHEEYLQAVAEAVPDLGAAGYVEFLREELGLGDDALRILAVTPLQNFYEGIVSEMPYAVKASVHSDEMIKPGRAREMVLEFNTAERKLTIRSKAKYELVDTEEGEEFDVGHSTLEVATSFGEPRVEKIENVSELFDGRTSFVIQPDSISLSYKSEHPLMSISVGEGVEVKPDSVVSEDLESYSEIIDIVHKITGVEKGAKGSRIYGVAGRLKALMRVERAEPKLAVEDLQVTRDELKKLVVSIVEEQQGVDLEKKIQQVKAIEESVYGTLVGRVVMDKGEDYLVDPAEAKVRAPSKMVETFKKILKKSGNAAKTLPYLRGDVAEDHGIRSIVAPTRESRGR